MTDVDEKGMRSLATATAVAVLRDAYPRQAFPDASVDLYVRMLSDLDGFTVAEAIKRLVRRSEWLPSISQIRMEVAEVECNLPTPAEAWELVTRPVGQAPSLHPIVKASMDSCGGRWNITHSERIETTRAQFLSDYEARRAHHLTQVATGVARAPQIESDRPKELGPGE